MDEAKKQALVRAGIDVDAALARMMGSEALFMRLIRKFPDDENHAQLCAAMERGDAQAALSASHTLKGVCGNLSMTGLFGLFERQVAALRAGDVAQAQALMEQIEPAYEAVCESIRGL